MKPITQQVILVTGTTSGLGRALAGALVSLGATVLVHGRNQESLDAVQWELQSLSRKNGQGSSKTYRADLSSLSEVRGLVHEIVAENVCLDAIVNNAALGPGNLETGTREESRDGVELRFAVNYLAPFLLTRQLVPLLIQSAPSRIVNVVSAGQQAIDFGDFTFVKDYTSLGAYCRSKLAQIMNTFDLAEELADHGVTANCVHPSTRMDTKMVLESFGTPQSRVQDGVDAVLPLVVSPGFDRVTGRYFDRKSEVRAHEQGYDRGARNELKRRTLEVAGPPTQGLTEAGE